MKTEELIDRLAADVQPVHRLPALWRRTVAWAICAAIALAAMVALLSPRDDIAVRVRDPLFVLEQIAALATALTAALAAFATAVPGRRRHVLWVPLTSAAVWIGVVAAGAVRDVSVAASDEAFLYAAWGCVAAVLGGSVVPAALMAGMLRRGAALTPRLTAALGGLAAAGLGNLAGCLSHPDSSAIVLVWHVGTVLAVAALAAMAGGHLLPWPRRDQYIVS